MSTNEKPVKGPEPISAEAPLSEKKGVMITPRQRQEYINQARDWWDKTGRHMVSQENNMDDTKRKFRGGGNAPGILTTGAREVVIPSGILNGRMFHNLTPIERARIVKVWMHHFTEFKFPDLTQREHDLMLNELRDLKKSGGLFAEH